VASIGDIGMGADEQDVNDAAAPAGPVDAVRHRDAMRTRAQLLQAARRRFAKDGYASTTVRDIATDAGVNVALINRYFSSKEGLFAACLTSAADDLDRPTSQSATLDQLIEKLMEQIVESSETSLQMLLLLRSSGDDQAERIRGDALDAITRRMAAIVGWHEGAQDAAALLLRTQVALAGTLGLILLRRSGRMQPLGDATAAQLREPLADMIRALMAPHPRPTTG
jgi:AcrR family transcriptional regulator